MSRAEYVEAVDFLRTLLIPEGVTVSVNGGVLPIRRPLHTFEAGLETEIADEHGILRRRLRRTPVSLHEVLPGEVASLYELGLPVVETGDRWHINVGQKVPLTLNRDNVPPAYLRTVRTLVLNEMHGELTADDAGSTWIQEATSDQACSPDAMRTFLDLRFGENRASSDPTDPEAGKSIQAAGGTLVTSRMLNKQQWQNAKNAGAIQPAGQIKPTARPYSQDPNAPAATIVPPDEWTTAIQNVVRYAEFLADELMWVPLTVTVVRTPNAFAACYGQGRLDLNLTHLGHKWFERGIIEEVDHLLIHEFAHEHCADHLSHDYHEALCRLGARLKRLALDRPQEFDRFTRQVSAA